MRSCCGPPTYISYFLEIISRHQKSPPSLIVGLLLPKASISLPLSMNHFSAARTSSLFTEVEDFSESRVTAPFSLFLILKLSETLVNIGIKTILLEHLFLLCCCYIAFETITRQLVFLQFLEYQCWKKVVGELADSEKWEFPPSFII